MTINGLVYPCLCMDMKILFFYKSNNSRKYHVVKRKHIKMCSRGMTL